MFAAQTDPARLWDWPMWVAAAMSLLGAAMLLWSFFGSDKSEQGKRRLVQKQSGGVGSVNLQAGRDITYKNKD
ncbi:hypothetical protein [Arthrobacter sp. NPDC058127]|uniref:hypothetical protein n=1 Tax=Arthrobacter sp. NPDC058127 TaxID=3346351 RepID=UPI0036E65770